MTRFSVSFLFHFLFRFFEYTVQCLLPYSVIAGGPLTDKYQLAVIRFHWGHDNSSGSEHSIDEQNYPLEVMYVTQIAREKKKRATTAP